jgi:sialidase-1
VRTFLRIAAAMLFALVASAAEPTPVYISGENGYHTYRIPSLLLTSKGTLLAFAEGRRGGRSDAGEIDLLLKRSLDEGQTWTSPQTVWADKGNTCGNPTPVLDEDTGTIWLLMTWNLGADKESDIMRAKSKDTRRVFVTSSNDDGQSWSKPSEITTSVKKSAWHWYATGPGNGIQLTKNRFKGRLVVPANHSELDEQNKPLTRSHVIYSDDHGKTWQLGGVEEEKTNESAIVELSDGTLLHNMRSYHGKNRRAIASSSDGGATWSSVTLDDALIEPVCQASMIRLTWPEQGKSRIAFSNPASVKRENLTLRLSYDEAKTWLISKILWPGPAAYSSLATGQDGSIFCLFEHGVKDPYERISISRLSPKDFNYPKPCSSRR